MFAKKKDKGAHATSVAEKVSIIAAGMQIHGDIESEGDIRIDGKVHGNIFCKARVVVISSGTVQGDIEAVNVDIHGTVNGNITALDLLSLKSKSNITGNLTTDKLQIEPNATFNGLCTMSLPPRPTGVNEMGLLFQEN